VRDINVNWGGERGGFAVATGLSRRVEDWAVRL